MNSNPPTVSMKKNLILAAVTLLASSLLAAPDQSMDKELTALAESLAKAATNANIKKIATLDFTDLQNNPTELGRFIAEQVAVNLVMEKRSFAVMDRANLKRILDEHKLSMSGLVNPENTKKLGQFSGVDAIIMGRITPLADAVSITATITLTDTAEVAGGAKTRIPKSQDIQQLLDRSVAGDTGTGGNLEREQKKEVPQKDFDVSRSSVKFGDLIIDLDSFRILQGGEILVALTFQNTNASKPIRFSLNAVGPSGRIRGSMLDDIGFEYEITRCMGISAPYDGWADGLLTLQKRESAADEMTLVEPRTTVTGTMRFSPVKEIQKEVGTVFKLQCEIIIGTKSAIGIGSFKKYNLVIGGIKPRVPRTQ